MNRYIFSVGFLLAFAPSLANAQSRTDQFGDPLPKGAIVRCGTTRIRLALVCSAVEWSPDGKQLWTLAGGRVQSWNVATGRELSSLGSIKSPITLRPFPDGRRLAVVGFESLTIVDVTTQRVLTTFDINAGQPAFSRDGSLLALGELTFGKSGAGRILVIDTKTLKISRKIVPSPIKGSVGGFWAGGHTAVAFLPDAKGLLSLGTDKKVRLWDIKSGKLVRVVCSTSYAVERIWVTRDGKTLITADTAASIAAWNIATGEKREVGKLDDSKIRYFDLSRDGKLLAITGRNGVTRIWELPSKKLLQTLNATQPVSRFSPDGSRLATQGLQVAEIWDWRNGRRVDRHVGHTMFPLKLAFSADGRRVHSIGADATLCVWDAQTGKLIRLVDMKSAVEGRPLAAFTSDGKRFAVINRKKEIEIRSVIDDRVLQTRKLDAKGQIDDLSFLHGGSNLAVHHIAEDFSKAHCRLLRLKTGKLETSFPQREAAGIVFRADDKQLALGQSNGFDLIDTKSGKLLSRFRAEAKSDSGYDGLACSFQNGIVVLVRRTRDFEKDLIHSDQEFYRLKDNRLLRTLKFPKHSIHSVAVSPDGKLLAATMGRYHAPTGDGLPRTGYLGIWDVASGRLLFEQKLKHAQHALAFSPNGRKLATGSMATDILVWDVPATSKFKRKR
jgi:WD40 repeat protein